jgi:hypothetical protein
LKQSSPRGTSYADTINGVLDKSGIQGFYKGFTPTALRLAGKEAAIGPIIKHTSQFTKECLHPDIVKKNPEAGFIISAPLNAAISTYGIGYLDRCRIHAMTSEEGVLKFVKDTHKESGISGLGKEMFKGSGINYANTTLGIAGYHVIHQELKRIAVEFNGQSDLSTTQEMGLSLTSGALVTATRSPLAVAGAIVMKSNSPVPSATMSDAFSHIFKEHGIKGFYIGIGPSLALGAVSSLVYQGSLDLIQKIEEMEKNSSQGKSVSNARN